MNFVFLTRCYKYTSNLEIIKNNLKGIFQGSKHTYEHIITVDLSHGYPKEEFLALQDSVTQVILIDSKEKQDTQLTMGMDTALSLANVKLDSYVYVLDDDNLLHPNFLKVCDYIKDFDAVVFKIEGRTNLGNPSIMSIYPVGHIDWANYITKYEVMKKLKIYDPVGTRCEDGLFFNKLKMNGYKITFIDEILAFYNKLPR